MKDESTLREQLRKLVYSPDGKEAPLELFNIDELLALFTATIEAEVVGAAVMGAKFGNAAFRQYNIADPGKPINLDTVRQMGIEQATEWAKRQC